jgi:hypothetical protein
MLINRMRELCNRPPFNQIGRHRIFEGDSNKLIINDGSLSDTEFKEISAPFTLDLTRYEELSFQDIINKIDQEDSRRPGWGIVYLSWRNKKNQTVSNTETAG